MTYKSLEGEEGSEKRLQVQIFTGSPILCSELPVFCTAVTAPTNLKVELGLFLLCSETTCTGESELC